MSHFSRKTGADVVTLPSIFSDHMVLQQASNVPIWGKASGVGSISVALADRSAIGSVENDGSWRVGLDLRELGPGPFEMIVAAADFQVSISDVVVGEVWLAAGQSNMQMLLRDTLAADSEISRSENALLRQFIVPPANSRDPLDDCGGKWMVASPETVGNFSGVGYYFSKILQRELGVPLGILNSSQGATPCEAWISRERLRTIPELWKGCEQLEKLSDRDCSGNQGPETGRDIGAKAGEDLPKSYTLGGALFNAMIHPVCPFGIRGAIWYQGESNVERAFQYRVTFPLLIADWRAHWQQGEFPFYFCQLANYQAKVIEPEESAWAELREAQWQALNVPNTAQAILIDVGEAENIHPLNKEVVGCRLAKIALAREYARAVPYSGPTYRSMAIENGAIRLLFDNIGGGLAALPANSIKPQRKPSGEGGCSVRIDQESGLEGFSICGNDRNWVWADAKVDGDSVLVWSSEIPLPVAVRYAWADNPVCNLGNADGFPASPFRTDDFPTVTRDVRYGFKSH